MAATAANCLRRIMAQLLRCVSGPTQAGSCIQSVAMRGAYAGSKATNTTGMRTMSVRKLNKIYSPSSRIRMRSAIKAGGR
jgi:hypothetical protein